MINLLRLSCGTNASYHCAKTLKEKFKENFRIIGTDINEQYLVSTYNYLDSFYKVPYASSPNYYETILEICKKEKIDYINIINDYIRNDENRGYIVLDRKDENIVTK